MPWAGSPVGAFAEETFWTFSLQRPALIYFLSWLVFR